VPRPIEDVRTHRAERPDLDTVAEHHIAFDERVGRHDRPGIDPALSHPRRLTAARADEPEHAGDREARIGHLDDATGSEFADQARPVRDDDQATRALGQGLELCVGDLALGPVHAPVLRGLDLHDSVEDEVAVSGRADRLANLLLRQACAHHVASVPFVRAPRVIARERVHERVVGCRRALHRAGLELPDQRDVVVLRVEPRM